MRHRIVTKVVVALAISVFATEAYGQIDDALLKLPFERRIETPVARFDSGAGSAEFALFELCGS